LADTACYRHCCHSCYYNLPHQETQA
jgi:hypothetical protein